MGGITGSRSHCVSDLSIVGRPAQSAFSLRPGLLRGPRFSIASGNDGSSHSKMVRGSDILSGGTMKDRPPRPLWRNRDFLLLWSGQTISVLGTNISTLALPLLVLVLTHSPALAGLLTAMRLLPYLLFSLAQISALPRVVSPAHLPRAYALDTTTEYAGSLLGPGLGGFIISLARTIASGAVLAYLADSISYLASVISLLFIRVPFQAERAVTGRPALRKEIAEGLRFLWQQHQLRIMALLTMTVNFLLSPVTLIVIVLAQGTLHLDVRTIGLILSASGVGGVLGGFIAPWARERLRFGQIIIGSVITWAIAILLLALATSSPVLIAGEVLVSLMWPVYGVTLVSYRLLLTPAKLQGRVNSAFRFLSYGSEPLGAAVGGLLLAPLGPRVVFGLIAVGLALSVLVASFTALRKA